MHSRSDSDSRDYIVAFELHSPNDCPSDFRLPSDAAGFDAGIFLPRDDPDWFGRSSYPPRLLLLNRGTLHIVPHPSAGKPADTYEIGQLVSVESGQMLLKGWLRFAGIGIECLVRYNTRGFPSVLRFLQRFRERFLDAATPQDATPVRLGPDLDIKFGNALERELDLGEDVIVQVFEPSRDLKSKRWFITRRGSTPGDLLALTSRRLVWITDRDRGSRARYGSVISYAPLRAVRAVELAPKPAWPTLRVILTGSRCWHVPIADSRNAGDFAKFVMTQEETLPGMVLPGEPGRGIDSQ